MGNVKANNFYSYSFQDTPPLDGKVEATFYYRLKIIDNDGKISYSNIEKLTTNNSLQTTHIFPNPAKNKITITGKNITDVQIIDNMGRVVEAIKNGNITSANISINLHIKAGIYIVKTINTKGETSTNKLVVEN
jgi:hypothetical protein